MNILDARFANPSEDTIAVLYQDETGNNVEVYVEVNEDDATYKSLVEAGYSKEIIIEKTVEAKKEYMRNVYNVFYEHHLPTHEAVMQEFERVEREKKEDLEKLDELIELRRQQFMISVASIKALKEQNNIKTLNNEEQQ